MMPWWREQWQTKEKQESTSWKEEGKGDSKATCKASSMESRNKCLKGSKEVDYDMEDYGVLVQEGDKTITQPGYGVHGKRGRKLWNVQQINALGRHRSLHPHGQLG